VSMRVGGESTHIEEVGVAHDGMWGEW
jgi:hypothetical protein